MSKNAKNVASEKSLLEWSSTRTPPKWSAMITLRSVWEAVCALAETVDKTEKSVKINTTSDVFINKLSEIVGPDKSGQMIKDHLSRLHSDDRPAARKEIQRIILNRCKVIQFGSSIFDGPSMREYLLSLKRQAKISGDWVDSILSDDSKQYTGLAIEKFGVTISSHLSKFTGRDACQPIKQGYPELTSESLGFAKVKKGKVANIENKLASLDF